ncbi:hypothetical protein M433DRAFT_69482 [Acidomyces richmondensis BFW]|nr:MAG: hypothetical protein FE78DRAFT_150309 [Acidomyces sp. 'richmondensis']KYG44410.1 hypothetical protein M433DRAFT_69482 [Acidomyces richmondensis BFW]
MARNTYFNPDREPLKHEAALRLNNDKIHGPFAFLNPTQAHFDHPGKDDPTSPQDDVPASNIGFKWTSRNNRKGRHALVIQSSDMAHARFLTPPPTNTLKAILKNIWRMVWYYPVWDVSWLVAYVFVWGSIVWVINAFFALLPYTNPSTKFPGESLYGGGISAFIGATIFELGSVLLMFEAVNENRSGCFGWALEQVFDEQYDRAVARISPNGCFHHHLNKRNFVGKAKDGGVITAEGANAQVPVDGTPPGANAWVWWPSWYELKTHYIHDLGFLACSSQMFGATVFWISGFTALPGIYNHLTPARLLNGAYWVPQVIGGSGFVVSGTLFMIETQKHWWEPAPTVLGWHIGFWNLIGGIGFTLCPIFGFSTVYWRQMQAACSTFWGSWAFLIGSCIQWYESLDKNPVETAADEQGSASS